MRGEVWLGEIVGRISGVKSKLGGTTFAGRLASEDEEPTDDDWASDDENDSSRDRSSAEAA